MSIDVDIIKEYLFLPDMVGIQFLVPLRHRLKFSKIGGPPDYHKIARAVYLFQGRLENGLFVYKFDGVDVE